MPTQNNDSAGNRRIQPDENVFPILVKVWSDTDPHDFRYIRKSLPSLLQSDLPDSARVILADDCSPDRRIRKFLEECAANSAHVTVWTNPHHMGPNDAHVYNVGKVVQQFPDARFYVFCDDDVLYHPGWISRLIQVYNEARQAGVEGIFTALNVPARPAVSTLRLPTSDVILKRRQFALNWLVPANIYHRVGPFRAIGIAYDTEYCQRLADEGLWIVCLTPSYVQNIGLSGFYQSHNNHDIFYAQDFIGRIGSRFRLEEWQWRFRHRFDRTVDQMTPGLARRMFKSMSLPIRKR